MNRGEGRFTDDRRFSRRAGDTRFANVTFGVPGEPEPFHASFWAHDGRIFQIAFDRSVRKALTASNIQIEKVKVMPEAIMSSG